MPEVKLVRIKVPHSLAITGVIASYQLVNAPAGITSDMSIYRK